MAVIFYLSGTGNSLYAARQAAAAFDDCHLESIGNYLRAPYKVEDDVVGVVCPVYCFALPPVVEKFMNVLNTAPGYAFGLVTMGGNSGRALAQLQQLWRTKGTEMQYARAIAMPDNFFCGHVSERPAMLAKAQTKLNEIAADLKARKGDLEGVKELGLLKYVFCDAGWWYLRKFIHVDAMQSDSAKCVGCGICEQVCSMANITMENGRPRFANNCANCLGCVHWCPQQAISAGKVSVDAVKRYTHPDITLTDIARKNS